MRTNKSGTPRPSTRRWRLLPFFSPIGWVGTHRFLGQWRPHHGTIHALPAPGNAFQSVILGKPRPPQCLKYTGFLPFQEMLVNCAGTAEALVGQRPLLTSGTQYVHNGFENYSRILGLAPTAGFAHVAAAWITLFHRQPWFHSLPEFVTDFPRSDASFGIAPSSSVLC